MHSGIFYRKQDESDECDAGHAVGFKAIGTGTNGVTGIVAGTVRDNAGISRVVFLNFEDNFHQVGADVSDFGENAAGDAQSCCAEGFTDGKSDKAWTRIVARNEQKDKEHHQKLDGASSKARR